MDEIIAKYCINKDNEALQCNGKCHLSKQLNTNTTSENNGVAIVNLTESFVMVYFEVASTITFQNIIAEQETIDSFFYNEVNHSCYLQQIDHPPEFLA